MKISLIVAMSSNRVIGSENRLPWHLSADLKKFKQLTWGHAIVMGRLTYESIGRPLPGRTNIIISRNSDYQQPGYFVYHDIPTALNAYLTETELFVIGGESLYGQFLPLADTIYITVLHQDFEGDTYFPELQAEQWRETDREDIDTDDTVPFRYSFIKLERLSDSAPEKT